MTAGFGFAQPYQSRLGSIASRSAAAAPKMMNVAAPAIDLSNPSKFPSLPWTPPVQPDKPIAVQTAPGPVDASAVTAVNPAPGFVPGLTTGVPAFTPTPAPAAPAAPAAAGVASQSAPAAGTGAEGGNLADLLAAIFGA